MADQNSLWKIWSSPDQFSLKKMVPPDQNSMENWSIVGPKFSGEDQFSLKILVPRTKIFADQFSSNSPLSDLDMAISPAGTLKEIPVIDPFKEGVLENEKQKVEILKRIDSELEVIADNVTSSTGLMVGKLELLISNQNKLINLM